MKMKISGIIGLLSFYWIQIYSITGNTYVSFKNTSKTSITIQQFETHPEGVIKRSDITVNAGQEVKVAAIPRGWGTGNVERCVDIDGKDYLCPNNQPVFYTFRVAFALDCNGMSPTSVMQVTSREDVKQYLEKNSAEFTVMLIHASDEQHRNFWTYLGGVGETIPALQAHFEALKKSQKPYDIDGFGYDKKRATYDIIRCISVNPDGSGKPYYGPSNNQSTGPTYGTMPVKERYATDVWPVSGRAYVVTLEYKRGIPFQDILCTISEQQ